MNYFVALNLKVEEIITVFTSEWGNVLVLHNGLLL